MSESVLCTYCGRKSKARTKMVGEYLIFEDCPNCESEILFYENDEEAEEIFVVDPN